MNGPGIVLQPTALSYDRVIAAGSLPTDIPANIQAGNTFSAPFIVNFENQAFLTTDAEQNFSVQEQVNLVGVKFRQLAGWTSARPFTATVYGQPRTVERVTLVRATDGDGASILSSRMRFEGGCVVGSGLLSDQLEDLSPA